MKKVFAVLGLLTILLISFGSCRNEEILGNTENSKEQLELIKSKSLWKENIVFISKVKRVFDKKVDAKKFSKKHGTAYWEYALSFEKDGEPYIFVPIVKDNKVEEVMLVLKDKKKIRFYFNKDDASKKAFFDILIKEKTAKAGSDVRKGNASNRLVCGWREITWMFENKDGSVSVYSSYDYFCVEVDAAYVDTDLGGDTGFDLADGDLPGGSDLDNPIDTTKVKTPCDKVKDQVSSSNYKLKYDELNKSSNFSEKKEKGFYETKDGWFIGLQQGASTSSSDGLKVPISSDTKGYTHTHIDNYETGKTDDSGNVEERQPIRMFSPADINTLMELAKTQTSGNYGDLYGTMLSSSGNYTIKFTGSATDIKTGFDTATWRADFKNFITNESGSLEKKFLKFLSEKMGVRGVSLYKLNNDGTVEQKSLSSDGKLLSAKCP